MTKELIDNANIHVPGYTLTRRLGAGGYGEVWLAEAPGGLTKAVKIVFGCSDDKRAARELHSLERMKLVRHPFLLSLERIEVIEDRLIIVTELADGSLRDRCEQCRSAGLPGIPREELLGYLRDTANALDYLSQHHNLQHLDVKPENLLLVTGYVKVADFGLVKEIRNSQVSLVGGLTPSYSSPEVFQGVPSKWSDQYSLAVVYQELLTGCLPFNGFTAAELTLQHIHDDPELSSLPVGERYVLAKALAKDPQRRFGSCTEFVNQLLASGQEGESAQVSADNGVPVEFSAFAFPDERVSRPEEATLLVEGGLGADFPDGQGSMEVVIPDLEPSAAPALTPCELKNDAFQPTPTLIVGIGGLARLVLQQYRRQLSDSFGGPGRIPAIQLLLLDTDRRSLSRAVQAEDESALDAEETLALPLRRPQEYRDSSPHLLRWLSRRWLYNIPKSLQTEGLRPLARLAFCDNARRTVQRLRMALTNLTTEENLTTSAELTHHQYRQDALRVYVVASVSGATGGGISLDIGYALRHLLQKSGIAQGSITGIFLHSTGRDLRFRDLAKVNTHAWLTEYNHFHRPGGQYTGDESCGLPSHPAGTPAFDHTYLVQVGQGLDETDLGAEVRPIAELLYLETFSQGQEFFDTSRKTTHSTAEQYASLRTVGCYQARALPTAALDLLAEELCSRVVRNWAGRTPSGLVDSACAPQTSDTNPVVRDGAQLLANLQINLEEMATNTRVLIETPFGKNPEHVLKHLLTNFANTGRAATVSEVVTVIDGLFSVAGAPESNCSAVLGRTLDSIICPLRMKLSTALQHWVLGRLNDPQDRLPGALRSAEWFEQHFQRTSDKTRELLEGSRQQWQQLEEQLGQDMQAQEEVNTTADNFQLALSYYRTRLDVCALEATELLTNSLLRELGGIKESLIAFGRHVGNIADSLAAGNATTARPLSERIERADGVSLLLAKLQDYVRSVDERFQREEIVKCGGLFEALMNNCRAVTDLLAALRRVCRETVDTLGQELTLAQSREVTASHSGSPGDSVAELARQLDPTAFTAGGVTNYLVTWPQADLTSEELAQLRRVYGDQIALLHPLPGEPQFWWDVGDVSLLHLAMQVIENRRDLLEYAGRVQTRSDLSWQKLTCPLPKRSSHTSVPFTQVV